MESEQEKGGKARNLVKPNKTLEEYAGGIHSVIQCKGSVAGDEAHDAERACG